MTVVGQRVKKPPPPKVNLQSMKFLGEISAVQAKSTGVPVCIGRNSGVLVCRETNLISVGPDSRNKSCLQ